VSAAAVPAEEFEFREGRLRDLHTTFEISAAAIYDAAVRLNVSVGQPPTDADVEREWERQRELIEFLAAQAGGSYWICEDGGRPVGYGRVCRLGEMEELTELMVLPSHKGRGIGRALLARCWPTDPTPDLGRLVVAAGASADLTLYTGFGVMPSVGHWHMRAQVSDYVERRAQEIDANEPAVHALEAKRAVAEWNRLEPPAIGQRRPQLHEFFGRTRSCLATMDPETGGANGLCWVGSDGEIGPAVGATPEDLVPVVLGALDRVASTREPVTFGVYCATDSWWLLRRLRGLGFRVYWPSWVMSSIPLPGLDRYMPTRPPHLL
jgi:GNAT superfamily N-acetyltransferase